MSYEANMLKDLRMPSKDEVKKILLISLFNHEGTIKEFNSNQEIVEELASQFNLNESQRNAYLETIYRKENRVKKSSLWHRLLFRAADSLAQEKLISRPSETFSLTNKKEWMLTELGINKALKIQNISTVKKEFLPTKSYEVQKVIKKLKESPRPVSNYNPVDNSKLPIKTVTREAKIRSRGFRLAIIEAYDKKCAVCNLKIQSPNNLLWEVEAAHIVPHSLRGKDDIWNGIALCRLHHWAFDVGWFSIADNYSVILSNKVKSLPSSNSKISDFDILKNFENKKIHLPKDNEFYPHKNAIVWHRENILFNEEK